MEVMLNAEGAGRFPFPEKINLLKALLLSGVFVDSPCGGNGVCGKCAVYASGALSPVTERERKLLSQRDIEKGIRLACLTEIWGECVVRPIAAGHAVIQTDAAPPVGKLNPLVELADFIFQRESAAGSLSDRSDENLVKALLAGQGVEVHTLSPAAVKKLPGLAIGKAYRAVVFGGEVLDIISVNDKAYGLAMDIGTTTAAAYFYDLAGGKAVYVAGAMNPQRAYGADVISRINAVMEDGENLTRQSKLIVGLINSLVKEFEEQTAASGGDVYVAVITGNTVMLHLFGGVDPSAIANAPFISPSFFGDAGRANDYGLCLNDQARIYLFECLSSYVGGDITAGILSSGMLESDKPSLLIDVGTNGEMALSCEKGLFVCSTAAGPAFEGACITCGTGSVEGAVDRVSMGDDGLSVTTIGGAKPLGICGSGLIDAVSVMLEMGIIDETGYMNGKDELEGAAAGLIDDEGNFTVAEGVYITPGDIRQVQLAKAAIAAGIRTLLHETDISCSELDQVYVAGGFGAHINIDSAAAIGLFPKEAKDKITVLGNSAGLGASQALLSKEKFAAIKDIVARAKTVELSASAFFQEAYVDEMMFE